MSKEASDNGSSWVKYLMDSTMTKRTQPYNIQSIFNSISSVMMCMWFTFPVTLRAMLWSFQSSAFNGPVNGILCSPFLGIVFVIYSLKFIHAFSVFFHPDFVRFTQMIFMFSVILMAVIKVFLFVFEIRFAARFPMGFRGFIHTGIVSESAGLVK
jgi:hypothetical protein